MRLKCAPGDFRVREVLDFVPDPGGPHYVHRLQKEKLDTLQALAIVASRARVPRSDIAFAGLKDRQGATEQWISIRGARVDFRERGVRCSFVGRSQLPVTSKMSRGNEFSIVVRDLSASDVDRIERCGAAVERDGFANYFDDQRFACLRHGQGFVMRSILEGRYDDALRRLIAIPSGVAITGDVKLKRILRENWGDWERCARVCRGPIYRRLFEHLCARPDDYRGAIALLPARLRLIHAFAYQSLLWNKAVDRFLRSKLAPQHRVATRTLAGSVVHWNAPPADVATALQEARTPLYGPGGGGQHGSGQHGSGQHGSRDFQRAMDQVLRDARLTDTAFEAHRVPGMVLRAEPRALCVVPRGLRVAPRRSDERHPGRCKVLLEFGLPRGSYATMLIKRLTAQPHGSRRGGARARSIPRAEEA